MKISFEKKLKEGTILTAAPVGYINTIKNGIKTVVPDSDMADKIRAMFKCYTSGNFSIRDMVEYTKT